MIGLTIALIHFCVNLLNFSMERRALRNYEPGDCFCFCACLHVLLNTDVVSLLILMACASGALNLNPHAHTRSLVLRLSICTTMDAEAVKLHCILQCHYELGLDLTNDFISV